MTFLKDILIIDVETTGTDASIAEPIQIGAILLDKQTLEETTSYSSYISHTVPMDPAAYAVHGISQETLANAPSPAQVCTELLKTFGTDVLLSSWVEHLDRRMLLKLFVAGGYEKLPYDYHFLDIWPLAYVHLLKQGYTGTFNSEPMFQAFGLNKRGNHDALDDCRRAAEVLRTVVRS